MVEIVQSRDALHKIVSHPASRCNQRMLDAIRNTLQESWRGFRLIGAENHLHLYGTTDPAMDASWSAAVRISVIFAPSVRQGIIQPIRSL